MEKTLSISVKSLDANGKQVVSFDGEFDKAGFSDNREVLDKTYKNFEGKILIFDFGKLKFINSEAIGYLMEIRAHLAKNDKKLVIAGLNSNVKDVFETIGMKEVIPLYDKVSDI